MKSNLGQLVGKRVTSLRETARLDKTQLALMTGISRQYVVRIENGTANPTLNVLEKLSSSLGVSVAELLRPESDTTA